MKFLSRQKMQEAADPSRIDQVTAALIRAQLHFEPIVRNQAVPDGRTYADLSEIIAKTRPALLGQGLTVVQLLDNAVAIDPKGAALHCTLRTTLVHKSGQSIGAAMPIPFPGIRDMQRFGAAVTYARRYALGAILGIAAEYDDDGEDAAAASGTEQAEVVTPDRREEQKQTDWHVWTANFMRDIALISDIVKLERFVSRHRNELGLLQRSYPELSFSTQERIAARREAIKTAQAARVESVMADARRDPNAGDA